MQYFIIIITFFLINICETGTANYRLIIIKKIMFKSLKTLSSAKAFVKSEVKAMPK